MGYAHHGDRLQGLHHPACARSQPWARPEANRQGPGNGSPHGRQAQRHLQRRDRGRHSDGRERRVPLRAARRSLIVALLVAPPTMAPAQDAPPRIPLVQGLVLGSVLHSPLGEREDVLEIASADSTGVHYAWHERTITADGDTTTGFRRRFVRANDLAGAPRFDDIFGKDEQVRPGFTALSISSAVYRELRDAGSAPFSMIVTPLEARDMTGRATPLSGLLAPPRARYKGSLTRVSPRPEPFPLLVNGSRAELPALRLKGSFADGLRRTEWDLWVLADSAHPLILKSVLQGDVFQMVRADLPVGLPLRDGQLLGAKVMEEQLSGKCRVELPGVY